MDQERLGRIQELLPIARESGPRPPEGRQVPGEGLREYTVQGADREQVACGERRQRGRAQREGAPAEERGAMRGDAPVENRSGGLPLHWRVEPIRREDPPRTLSVFVELGEHLQAEGTSARGALTGEPRGVREANDNIILWLAVQNGHIKIAQLLLQIASVRTHAHADNNKALVLASEHGHIEIVQMLLQIDAVRNHANADDNRALVLATENGHAEIVRELLKVEVVRQQVTASHNKILGVAAQNGHIETVRELLQLEAVRNNANAFGNRAFILAAANGHTRIVQELSQIALVWEHADALHNSALVLASENGYTEIVQELLKIEPVRQLEGENARALSLAAKNGHRGVVKLLLEIEEVRQKISLLKEAMLQAAENGHQNVVAVLFSLDNVQHALTQAEQQHPVIRAVEEERENILSFFKEKASFPKRDHEDLSSDISQKRASDVLQEIASYLPSGNLYPHLKQNTQYLCNVFQNAQEVILTTRIPNRLS